MKGYRCCKRRSIGKVLNERMITFTVLLIRSGCQSVCLNFLFWKVVGLTGATKCGFWTSEWAENWRQEIQLKNRTWLLLFWSIYNFQYYSAWKWSSHGRRITSYQYPKRLEIKFSCHLEWDEKKKGFPLLSCCCLVQDPMSFLMNYKKSKIIFHWF